MARVILIVIFTTVILTVVGTVTTNDVQCTDGWKLLADESDCNAFYSCEGTTPLRRRCPPGLHFSLLLQHCDWPSTAGCSSRREQTQYKAEGTTALPISENNEQSLAAEVCSRATSNRWHLPFPGDCRRHIKCQPGLQGADASTKAANAAVFTCPATLHFNARLQVCDWPNAAGCDGGITKLTIELQKDDNLSKPGVQYKGNKILLRNENTDEYLGRNWIIALRNTQQPGIIPNHNSSESGAYIMKPEKHKNDAEKQTQGEKPSHEGMYEETNKRARLTTEIIEQHKRKISESFGILNQSYSNQSELNLGEKRVLTDQIIERKNSTQTTHSIPWDNLAEKNKMDWKTKALDDIMKNFKTKLEAIRFDFSKMSNKSEKDVDYNNFKDYSRTYITQEEKENHQQMDPNANITANNGFANSSNISQGNLEHILRRNTNIDLVEQSYEKKGNFKTEKDDLETNKEQSYEIHPKQVHKLLDKKHKVDVFDITKGLRESFKGIIEKELNSLQKIRPERLHYLNKTVLNQTQQSNNESNNEPYVDTEFKKGNTEKYVETTKNITIKNNNINADQFDSWNIMRMKTPNFHFEQRHGEISKNWSAGTNFSIDAASNRSENAAYFKRIKKLQEKLKNLREKDSKEKEIIKNYTNNGGEIIENDHSFEDYHDNFDGGYKVYHFDILGYNSTEINDDSVENTRVNNDSIENSKVQDDSNENIDVEDFSIENIEVNDDSIENSKVKDDSNENITVI